MKKPDGGNREMWIVRVKSREADGDGRITLNQITSFKTWLEARAYVAYSVREEIDAVLDRIESMFGVDSEKSKDLLSQGVFLLERLGKLTSAPTGSSFEIQGFDSYYFVERNLVGVPSVQTKADRELEGVEPPNESHCIRVDSHESVMVCVKQPGHIGSHRLEAVSE